jgi:hypothetical protein
LLKEPIGTFFALGPLDPQPHRHESGIERAFGQQSAEEVGGLEYRKKRVGERARAEHRGNRHVARESEQPRRQCRAAHGGNVARQRHELPSAGARSQCERASSWHCRAALSIPVDIGRTHGNRRRATRGCGARLPPTIRPL